MKKPVSRPQPLTRNGRLKAMSKPIRELEITLHGDQINIRNYSAISHDVDELKRYLHEVGISTSTEQFSFCG